MQSPITHLTNAHYQHLKASAISDDIIKERQYRSFASLKELALADIGYDDLWSKPTLKQILPGLLLPVYPVGEPPSHCVIKPDAPRVFSNGRSPKYEHPQKTPLVLDILPRYRSLLSDTTIPLWITEGAKKADALASALDMAVVPASINGVYGWSAGGILQDFDALALRGRPVVLVPDGDIQHNRNVLLAITRLAKVLERKGATVILCELPDDAHGAKIGVDDFLAAGNDVAALLALLTPWKAPTPTQQGQQGAAISDVVQSWAVERDSWAYDPARDVYRFWTGTHWQEARPIDVDAKVADLLCGHDRDTRSGAANDVQRFAKPKLARTFTHTDQYINFANGTFDVTATSLRPHSPDDQLTYCLPFDYDPQAPTDTISTFLDSTIPDPIARLCYMVQIGLALLGDTTRHAFLYLIGRPRSGKSTLLALAQYVTGRVDNPHNFAGASLLSSELEGKRARYKWVDQRLVSIDEIKADVALRSEEVIKIISAHGGAESRGMNKDEQTSNQWTPKLIFAANDAPRFTDNSGALQARMHIIRCPNSNVGKEDFDLFPALRTQAGGFASVCLGLALRLVRCRLGMPISAAMIDERDELAQQNPLRAFVRERCVIGSSEKDRITAIYDEYKTYCTENGYKAMGQNKLLSSLKDSGIDLASGWLGNARAYVGIRLLALGEGPSYQHTNTPPTLFDKSVGSFLRDWEGIKQAATNIPTDFLDNRSHATFFSFSGLEENMKTETPITESSTPAKSVGVLVDDDLPHSNAVEPTNTLPTQPAKSVGSVGISPKFSASPTVSRRPINLSAISMKSIPNGVPNDLPFMELDAYLAALVPEGLDD